MRRVNTRLSLSLFFSLFLSSTPPDNVPVFDVLRAGGKKKKTGQPLRIMSTHAGQFHIFYQVLHTRKKEKKKKAMEYVYS